MTALLSSPYRPSSLFRTSHLSSHRRGFDARRRLHLGFRCSSSTPPRLSFCKQESKKPFSLKECAISVALAIGLVTGLPAMEQPAHATAANSAIPDVSVLISGPPIKDPGALLRYALPIDNKAIREVQKPLEDITDSLKVAGVRALDSVERNVRQASRALSQGKKFILAGVPESKKAEGQELLDKLAVGLKELQRIVEERDRDAVAPKQKELLQYVGRWGGGTSSVDDSNWRLVRAGSVPGPGPRTPSQTNTYRQQAQRQLLYFLKDYSNILQREAYYYERTSAGRNFRLPMVSEPKIGC